MSVSERVEHVMQDTLFTAEEVSEQVLAKEGIRVHIELAEKRYFTRTYGDVYPLTTTGTITERMNLIKQRLIHMDLHYGSHARKTGERGLVDLRVFHPG